MDSSHYAALSGAATTVDDEEAAHPSTLTHSRRRSSLLAVATTIAAAALLLLLAISSLFAGESKLPIREQPQTVGVVDPSSWVGRGVDQGVSDKSSGAERLGLAAGEGYSWTNAELAWQRTAFHFQPERNWMNDPNGPMFYKGWYHLFYQYNPVSALWGNITWGHAVSRDLINWFHLPAAMVKDHWYDANGVWSGSATLLPDGKVIMLYTGSVNESAQVQNLAYPVDLSDPLLLEWVKSEANPILVPPQGVPLRNFRDPSTAWFTESDSSWRIAIGVKDDEHTGKSLVYRTEDFVKYDLVPGALHAVPGTGMWECVDFYPVSTTASVGLNTSADGPGVRHVLKASRDDDMHDYYAIGSYDAQTNAWTPDDPEADVGVGLLVDYGKYYASKTFYDQKKKRRLIWAWIGETDSARTDLKKGWASVQSVPRAVRFDEKTGSNLLQWPVEELESLRSGSKQFSNISIAAGSVVPLEVGNAAQLDILSEFEVTNEEALDEALPEDAVYNCTTSSGSAARGALGPFGMLVLADVDRTEQTAVYFYIAKGANGKLTTFVCTDEMRSSHANDIVKSVYGSTVPILNREKLSLRILVDHSIVETFAQGGRTCITSRVYPTKAIHDSARMFLFNNATNAKVTAVSVKVWGMSSARFLPFSHLNHTMENNLV